METTFFDRFPNIYGTVNKLILIYLLNSAIATPAIAEKIVKLILTNAQVDHVKIMESACRDQILHFIHRIIDNQILKCLPYFLKSLRMKMQVVMNVVRQNLLS